MFRTLGLLIPALVPSWRFFDAIAASPRVEYALLPAENVAPDIWEEFRPRPQQVSLMKMARRMLWNPYWNESLFLVSCAERLIDAPTDHSAGEIFSRIGTDLAGRVDAPFYQFRLVFVRREGEEILRDVEYISCVRAVPKALAA